MIKNALIVALGLEFSTTDATATSLILLCTRTQRSAKDPGESLPASVKRVTGSGKSDMNTTSFQAALSLCLSLLFPISVVAQESLPKPIAPFYGTIGKTYKDSKSEFPQPITPPKGAPNVLIILVDDLGFGGTATFGGLIPTPNIDKLAHNGLILNAINNTALCSPSRAALLSGRNHHQLGMGGITEGATGFPGYNSV